MSLILHCSFEHLQIEKLNKTGAKENALCELSLQEGIML
jgi:hypothetical protein